MAKKITIYTTTTCPSCSMVKRFLNSKGHAYNEVNVDEQPDQRQVAINLSGAMTVPVTVIQDEADASSQQVSVGWNPGQLAAALAV